MDKRKVSRQWQKNEIKSLIEEFEARPDLWDPSRPNYQNRNIKQKLLKEISEALKLNSQEVSAKLHSLRTQFNRECSKERTQKSGSGSDEAYTSKWEYLSSLQFLKVSTVPGETMSNLEAVLLESTDSSSISSFELNSSESESTAPILVSCNTFSQSENSEPSTSSKRQRTQPAAQRNTKKKCSKGDENIDVLLMEQAMAVMNKKSDEWDIFGQFVASELRQIFDSVQRNAVKRSIMSILITHGIPEQTANGYTSETAYVTLDNGEEYTYL